MASLRNRCPRGLGGLSISIPTADTHDDDEPEPSSPGTPEAMVSPWQADSAEAMKALHTPTTPGYGRRNFRRGNQTLRRVTHFAAQAAAAARGASSPRSSRPPRRSRSPAPRRSAPAPRRTRWTTSTTSSRPRPSTTTITTACARRRSTTRFTGGAARRGTVAARRRGADGGGWSRAPSRRSRCWSLAGAAASRLRRAYASSTPRAAAARARACANAPPTRRLLSSATSTARSSSAPRPLLRKARSFPSPRRRRARELQQWEQVETQRESDRGELRRRRSVPCRAQTVVVFSKPW